MYSVLKPVSGAHPTLPSTTFYDDEFESKANDVWLFTDPAAKELYIQQGRISQLERDIRTYVMYNGAWCVDEMECKRELHRLVRARVLAPKLTFGYLSPHPTIYQAIEEGVVLIAGEKYPFDPGDEVVFEPWLARLYHPRLPGPLRVGRFDSIGKYYLSSEAFPQWGQLCEKDFEVLHQILYSSRKSM